MVIEKFPVEEEYKGERPGCYKCKQPISKVDDFYRLTWVGKTWEMTANYHLNCLIDAFQAGDIQTLHGETGQGDI